MQAKQIQKYQKKSIAELIKLATKYFNAYVRKRDSKDGYFVCISCQERKPVERMHAGHFLSAGHHGAVRFDERNVHGQCHHCNTFLHGNILGYQEGLIAKIGIKAVQELKQKSQMRGFRWDRFALIDLITTYQHQVKNYEHET